MKKFANFWEQNLVLCITSESQDMAPVVYPLNMISKSPPKIKHFIISTFHCQPNLCPPFLHEYYPILLTLGHQWRQSWRQDLYTEQIRTFFEEFEFAKNFLEGKIIVLT